MRKRRKTKRNQKMVGKEGRCRRQKLSQEEAQSQKEVESREEGGIKEAAKEGGGAILSPVLHFVFLWPPC